MLCAHVCEGVCVCLHACLHPQIAGVCLLSCSVSTLPLVVETERIDYTSPPVTAGSNTWPSLIWCSWNVFIFYYNIITQSKYQFSKWASNSCKVRFCTPSITTVKQTDWQMKWITQSSHYNPKLCWETLNPDIHMDVTLTCAIRCTPHDNCTLWQLQQNSAVKWSFPRPRWSDFSTVRVRSFSVFFFVSFFSCVSIRHHECTRNHGTVERSPLLQPESYSGYFLSFNILQNYLERSKS